MNVLPLEKPTHLYPVRFETKISSNSESYFVGFNVDRTRFSTKKPLNIEQVASRFREFLVQRFEMRSKLDDGMDFFVDYHPQKRLPKEVFEV